MACASSAAVRDQLDVKVTAVLALLRVAFRGPAACSLSRLLYLEPLSTDLGELRLESSRVFFAFPT